MVEKITVSPQEVRGYGNVVDDKELDDYGFYRCDVSESSDVIKGVRGKVFSIESTAAPSLSISSATENPVGERCVIISASLKDDGNNMLVGRAVSLKEGDNVLATAVSGQNTAFAVVLNSGTHQLYAVFEGDDEYPPVASDSIQVIPAKSFWDVEHEFDYSDYVVGSDILVSGSLGTLYDEIVDGEVVTGRLMESNVRVILATGSETLFCTTDEGGNFEFEVHNVQTNSFRIVIASDERHRVFNQFIDVPVHDYSLAIAESDSSTSSSTVLVVGLTDFNSEVEGAEIEIEGSDGSVYTALTDSLGEAVVNVGHLLETTTFTVTYQNVSASCTVTVDTSYDISYVLDSSTRIIGFTDFESNTFSSFPGIEDGAFVVNYGRGYNLGMLSQGWDNTVDWTLECDFMQNRWDSHLSVFLGLREHYNDYEPYSRLQLSCSSDRFCGKAGVEGTRSVSVKWASPSYTANAWTRLVIEKRNEKYVTVKVNGTTIVNNVEWEDLMNYDTCYIGGASWWNSSGTSNPSGVRIRNIHVSSYSGD